MNKLTTALFATVFTLGYSAMVSAHTINGSLGAGTANEPAVDVYRANCFAWPAGGAPAGEVSGNGTRMAVDYTGSGTNIHRVSIVRQNPTTVGMTSVTTEGSSVNRAGTNGDFYLMVSRTTNSTTASTYTLNYHCQNAAAQHTGTTDEVDILGAPYLLQDQ
jgi:hypothetical protein